MLCASTMNLEAKEPKETTFKLKRGVGTSWLLRTTAIPHGRLCQKQSGDAPKTDSTWCWPHGPRAWLRAWPTFQDSSCTHTSCSSLITEATVPKGEDLSWTMPEINGQDGRAGAMECHLKSLKIQSASWPVPEHDLSSCEATRACSLC